MNSSRKHHRLYMRKYRKTDKSKNYMKAYFADYYKRDYAREAKNKRQRKYRAKNGIPDVSKQATRKSYLKCVYGLTLKDYTQLLKKQQYRCGICRIHRQSLTRCLAVDHNHLTGKVRGLLCHKCNAGIGSLRDSATLLRKATDYLARYES